MLKKKLLIAGLFLFLFTVATLTYLSTPFNVKKDNQEISLLKEATKKSQQTSDYNALQKNRELLIAEYTKIGDLENVRKTTLELAAAALAAHDIEKGVALYKSVLLDPATTPRMKSEGVAMMATSAYSLTDTQKALKEIFSDPRAPFATALGKGDINRFNDLELALKNLYEETLKNYPLSYLSYRTALWYSTQLIKNDSLSDAEKNFFIEHAQTNLSQGDALLKNELVEKNFRETYTYQILQLSTHYRFITLTFLARHDKNYLNKATQYKDAILNRYENRPSIHTRSLTRYTRFYYAALLADISGQEKKEEIATLVQPILVSEGEESKVNASIWNFFERELTQPKEDRSYNEKFILKIASLVPEFNKFLTTQGWKK